MAPHGTAAKPGLPLGPLASLRTCAAIPASRVDLHVPGWCTAVGGWGPPPWVPRALLSPCACGLVLQRQRLLCYVALRDAHSVFQASASTLTVIFSRSANHKGSLGCLTWEERWAVPAGAGGPSPSSPRFASSWPDHRAGESGPERLIVGEQPGNPHQVPGEGLWFFIVCLGFFASF